MNQAEPNEIKLHFLDYWRVIRVRFGIIILAFLLVVITAAIATYFSERLYRSTVTMEVQPDAADVKIFERGGEGAFGDPRFAATQFQIIQLSEILNPVIDELKLQEKWSPAGSPISKGQAFERLGNMMMVKDRRNTNLIDVTVMSTDPEEAAQIANTVSIVYQNRRVEEQEKMVSRAMAQLQDEVAKQQRKVEEASAEVLRVARDLGINDLSPLYQDDVITPGNQNLVSSEQEANQLSSNVAALRTKLEQIEKLKGEELMRALPTLDIQDPTVMKIMPQFQDVEAAEARLLNSGLGVNHPEIKALRAQRAVFIQQLSEQTESIRRSLEINLHIAESTLESLNTRLDKKRADQLDTRSGSSEYTEAKNRFIQAQKILEGAQTRYQTQIMELNMPKNPAKIWQRAEPDYRPAKPNVKLNMLLGTLIGLIVGIGLAFFIEYLDTSVKTLDDVESFLGVPVLAVIPQNISLLHRQPSDTPDAEAYRILRTNVEFNRKSADANAITVVSGGPGEGKSTTLANLAYTCAQGGYNVLVVDADLRRPVQHELFGIENELGLTNYLTTDLPLEEVIRKTNIENLWVMTSGILPSDAVGVLNSQRMSDMIADLKARYDIIFFDSPPILGVSDASVLASEVDLTIIVVQHRRFPRSMLQRVKQAVTNVGGTVLGVVLNNVDTKHDQGYEYYTSYYNYYYSSPKDRKRRGGSKAAAGAEIQDAGTGGRDEY